MNVGPCVSGAVAIAAPTSGFSGAAAAAPPPKEKEGESKEEIDDAMGFSLFD